jgi:hypothetical protein
MVIKDVLHPLLRADVGVNFCGKDAFVPEHLLHNTEVCAVLNKVGCERVAESMRGDLLCYAGNLRLLPYHGKDHYPAELPAPAVEE